MLIHSIPSFLQKLTPSLTWKVNTTDKKIFLTFDDGPHPEITPWVLDLLDQYNAKATFFCVGDNVQQFKHTFQQIMDRGHSVGNHTFNHLNGWTTKDETYIDNIEKAASLIPGNLFRPPYGKITPLLAKKLKTKYRIVMWDVLTYDFEPNLNIKKALKTCISLTRKGSIVVFHDSKKAESNLRLFLPRYIQYFSEKGFTFEIL